MADHSLPTTTRTYVDYTSELKARMDDLCKALDIATVTATNLPSGTVAWNSTLLKWQKYNGTAWSDLSTSYSININGTVGAATPSTGAFTTLSTSGAATLSSGTVGGAAIVSTSASQTLTNKTLTTPVISTISNTGILTLPTSTDTLVGRATTDTLTNKTLTAPRFANAGFIADSNGNELIKFVVTTAATNEVTFTNAATGSAPKLEVTGNDANISFDIAAKGTGIVRYLNAELANVSSVQTFTNKTWNGVAIAQTYGGTGGTTPATAKVALEIITGLTGSARLPTGTTAERDGTPNPGYIRLNTTLGKFEGYNGTAWGSIGGGATGGGADEVFIENSNVITTSYTISANRNAMSTGPITINNGVSVTVPSGARWVII